MTILVEKEACEIEKVRELGINIQDDGENYLLEVTGIVDTGADVCCASDGMMEALGRAPLRDALGRVFGIGGSKGCHKRQRNHSGRV